MQRWQHRRLEHLWSTLHQACRGDTLLTELLDLEEVCVTLELKRLWMKENTHLGPSAAAHGLDAAVSFQTA